MLIQRFKRGSMRARDRVAPHRSTRAQLSCLALLAGVICACTSQPPERDAGAGLGAGLEGAPAWVLHGCGGVGRDRGRWLCGVGSMGASRNPVQARSTAIGRARSELARGLELRVQAMLKSYQGTSSGGAELGRTAADAQHVIDVSRQITQLSIAGSELRETWQSGSGTWFALVVLDIERFERSVDEMERLSVALRLAIQQRARGAFEASDPVAP